VQPFSYFNFPEEFFVMHDTDFGSIVVSSHRLTNAGTATYLGARAPDYAGGGWLALDRQGALIGAFGDAGQPNDPSGSAQSDDSLLGKVFRVTRNPDPYAGASINYFFIKRIAKGVHWPNGGSLFGSSMLFADRGETATEELNLLPLDGGTVNLGWPIREGTLEVGAGPTGGVTDPVAQYPHGDGARSGQSIVGGAVGPGNIASLADMYVFADGKGAIFAVKRDTIAPGATLAPSRFEIRTQDFEPDQGAIDKPVAIHADAAGTLYILDGDGEVFRVDPA
jgi:hypothetical protein